jgi:hypothetical protein
MRSEARNTAISVVVVAIMIAAIFFVPHRIELTGDIAWSPLYRGPLEYQAFDTGASESAVITALDSHISWGWYIAELVALALVGWITIQVATGIGEED